METRHHGKREFGNLDDGLRSRCCESHKVRKFLDLTSEAEYPLASTVFYTVIL